MSESSRGPVRCPICRKRGDWFAGDYGPFCSKRCKLIDLGKWLGGEYSVSEPLPAGELRKLDDRDDRVPHE